MEIRGKKEKEHLILKYDDKAKKYVDVTNQIIYMNDESNSWYVVFAKNGEKGIPFHIKKDNLVVSVNPVKIDFNRENVFINNKKTYDVLDIIKFDNLGYKIFLKNFRTMLVKNIVLTEDRVEINYIDQSFSKTHNVVFDYYKNLAKYASDIALDDDSIENLILDLYNNVNGVQSDTVLESYTNCKIHKIDDNKINYIFPFSTNLSQITAIKQTFKNNLSVISGPPGTGKTQVILNLISNAVINNKTVAVISNNNTAIDNVYEKLKENNLDYIPAYLGNSENVEKFFSVKDDLNDRISNLEKKSNADIDLLIKKLGILYRKQNELVKLKQDYYELNEEFKHYQDEHSECVDYSNLFDQSNEYDNYLNLKFYLLSKKDKLNIFNKIKLKWKYKFKSFKYDLEELITFIEYKFFEKRLCSIQTNISNTEAYITENNIDGLNRELKNNSRIILDNYIINKYHDYKPNEFTKFNYRTKFKEFVNRYPVILSTTHSLLRNIEYGYKFDLVIIDEASQSDILTSLLTMNITKQMVVVGDTKQLSQIDNQEIYSASEKLIKDYGIKKCFQYKDNSILQSVLSLPCDVTNTVLKEHYRCDARIIEFCNKKYYDGELIVCTKTSDANPLVVVHTVVGNHARKNPNGTGQYNDREAQEIIEILKQSRSKDIGIITPFRAQAEYIQSLIKTEYPDVEVDTIHKYQGRQKEIVILSTVVNSLDYEKDSFITDFVTNSQLLNVAISRAIKKIYLVVSDKVYNSKSNSISELIDYINYYCSNYGNEVGKVASIFDALYTEENSKVSTSVLSKYVDSYAEELMLNLLNKVLKDYPNYKIQMHYRLRYLVNKIEGFTADEVKYINHPKTHVDFVIFNKITHRPILCIEVDGTRFHDYAKKQIKHDIIKDRVLVDNGLKILRLKTNQSNEEERIRKYL